MRHKMLKKWWSRRRCATTFMTVSHILPSPQASLRRLLALLLCTTNCLLHLWISLFSLFGYMFFGFSFHGKTLWSWSHNIFYVMALLIHVVDSIDGLSMKDWVYSLKISSSSNFLLGMCKQKVPHLQCIKFDIDLKGLGLLFLRY